MCDLLQHPTSNLYLKFAYTLHLKNRTCFRSWEMWRLCPFSSAIGNGRAVAHALTRPAGQRHRSARPAGRWVVTGSRTCAPAGAVLHGTFPPPTRINRRQLTGDGRVSPLESGFLFPSFSADLREVEGEADGVGTSGRNRAQDEVPGCASLWGFWKYTTQDSSRKRTTAGASRGPEAGDQRSLVHGSWWGPRRRLLSVQHMEPQVPTPSEGTGPS